METFADIDKIIEMSIEEAILHFNRSNSKNTNIATDEELKIFIIDKITDRLNKIMKSSIEYALYDVFDKFNNDCFKTRLRKDLHISPVGNFVTNIANSDCIR